MDYWDALENVINLGETVESRAGSTRELINLTIETEVENLPRRVTMARTLGYMELLQFLAGTYEPNLIARVAPKVDLSLFGRSAIYGPRVMQVRDQLRDAIQELRINVRSRRAIVTITAPAEPLGDQPCISSLQFLVRNDKLFTVATARSWDLWFGAPHDLIVLSGVTQVVANCLGLRPMESRVLVNAVSAHVYEAAVPKIQLRTGLWRFWMPRMASIYGYRDMAERMKNNPAWIKGAPQDPSSTYEISEDFPHAPKPFAGILDPNAPLERTPDFKRIEFGKAKYNGL